MKHTITLLGLLLIVILVAQVAWAGPRDARWKKVEEAKEKGLPKTAATELEPIIAAALKDKAHGEAIKAIGLKIALESNIEGNKPEEKITRMQAEIAKAPAEMKPVMEAILANWYWHYFLRNRHRFMQRTQTVGAPGDDVTTWDLPRILREIDLQFTKALAHEARLKATPVSAYNDLLVKGTTPDSYRPTIYDFLAFNALDFYTTGEQGAIKDEDEFELAADSPIFGTVEQFLQWRPLVTDTHSPTLKAIRLYQDLLAFHFNDQDKTAFIDADLWRLNFGHNKTCGEDKSERYQAALTRFAAEWANHEISARALHEGANLLNTAGESLEAHRLAQLGADAFPNSIGGRMCFNLIQQIRAKSADIITERVWNEPLPSISVSYRNVSKVYFRMIAYDFDSFIRSQRYRVTDLDREQRHQLLAAKPTLVWAADLPPTVDFKQRTEQLLAPKNLKAGFYFLVASHDPSFGEKDNQVSFAPVWVSDIALVMRTRTLEGAVEGFVLNAVTGVPLAGATVRAWVRNQTDGWFQPIETTTTDDNGLFRFGGLNGAGVFLAEHGGQRLATSHEYWAGTGQRESDPYTRTVFFTDRSLYRPGQTIQYKGICFHVDQVGNQYQTLSNQDLTVTFHDTNHQEIARQQHKTNDYGAFSGSFNAPRDRLTGRMGLQVQDGPAGSASFNVEEYKRPKFQVELSAPKEAAKLNSEVRVLGKATAYTGAAIGGAKVKYRVVREVRLPVWCWWGSKYLPPGREPSQAIAHGTVVTGSDGSFKITFAAKPDASIPEKDEPSFDFTVHADVTDSTGETRSGQQSLRVGYSALQAALSANEWQTADKPVVISIDTRTFDGQGQAATGTLKVYALKQPSKIVRPELHSRHQHLRTPLTSGSVGGSQEKADRSDPNVWEHDELIDERAFQTDENGSTTLSLSLKPGI